MFRLGIQFCAVVWCPTYLATTGAARAAYWPTNENRENIRKKIASWKQLSNMVPNMFRRCFLRIITLQTQRMFILIILFFFVLIWISRFQISGCRRQRWTNFQIPSQILTGPLFQRTQGSNTLQGARSPTCDFIWCPTSATLPENDCLQAIPNGAIINKVGVKGFQVGRILVRGWAHGPPTMLWRPQGGQVVWTHHCFQMIPA